MKSDLNLKCCRSAGERRGTQYARSPRVSVRARVLTWAFAACGVFFAFAHSALNAQGTRVGQYRVQPGDVLQYKVWPKTEASGDFPVEMSGMVYLPSVGAVPVGGKTLDEVRATLRDLYAKAVLGAIDPVVTVTAMFPFSVTGGVLSGGLYDGKAGMTVFDAISRAGGYINKTRPSHVDVIHADGTTTRLDGADMQLTSVVLQSQDRVTVPSSSPVFTKQNLALAAQLLIGLVTMIKLF